MAKTEFYGLGTFAFPRGWFVIGASQEVTTKPQGVRFFGQELALYRGESGRIVLLDAHCPHLKANLARNTTSFVVHDGHVQGDSITCPLHAWRFGPDGRCNYIPYHKGPIPEAAKVRSWRVEERYGMVLAWYDPEGGAPDFEPPVLPEWEDSSWVRWEPENLGIMPIHPVELLDNMADIAHFGPVHGLGKSYEEGVAYYENEIKGITLRQRQGGAHRAAPDGGIVQFSDGVYTGPGLLFTHITNDGQSVIMLAAHTPVDDGTVAVFFGLMVKTATPEPSEMDLQMAKAYVAGMRSAFGQDFEIWQYKEPCAHPMQLRTDGPFDKIRGWYKQFYNPRDQAAEFQRKLDGKYTVPGIPACPVEEHGSEKRIEAEATA